MHSLLSTVVIASYGLTHYRAAGLPSDSTVQASLAKAGFDDVCAHVKQDRIVPFGEVDAYICKSQVPAYVRRHYPKFEPSLENFDLLSIITNVITSMGTSCTYPPDAIPTPGPLDICAFDCSGGYTLTSTAGVRQCRCTQPDFMECAGHCVHARKCSADERLQFSKRRIGRWQPSVNVCPPGWNTCAAPSRVARNARTWECIDGFNDLENCGGCIYPFVPGDALGRDCTAIPHISDVACRRGACVVQRCMPGYIASADGTQCEARSNSQSGLFESSYEGSYYGPSDPFDR